MDIIPAGEIINPKKSNVPDYKTDKANKVTDNFSDKATRIKAILEKENLEVVDILKESEIATTIKVRKNGQDLILKVFNFESENFDDFREELESAQEKLNQDYFENEKLIYNLIYPKDYIFGNNYLVMPDWGIDLKKYLTQGKIAKSSIYSIIEKILQNVISLHQKKIYHNDLRSSNFIIELNRSENKKSFRIRVIDFQDSVWDDAENKYGSTNQNLNFNRNKDLNDLIFLFNELDEKYNLHLRLNEQNFLSLADLSDYLFPRIRKHKYNITKYSLLGLPVLLFIFSINFLFQQSSITPANASANNQSNALINTASNVSDNTYSISNSVTDQTVSSKISQNNSKANHSSDSSTSSIMGSDTISNLGSTTESIGIQNVSPKSTSEPDLISKTGQNIDSKSTPTPTPTTTKKVKNIKLNLFQNRSQSQIILTFELKNFTKPELTKGKIYFQINNYGWQVMPGCSLNNSGCILNRVDKLKNYTFKISINSLSAQKAIVTY